MKTPKPFLGTWRITETKVWDKDALDLVVAGSGLQLTCYLGVWRGRFFPSSCSP